MVCFVHSDGSEETFNVVVFYVSDLGHKKEVLGRTQITAMYGCPHCEKKESNLGRLGGSIRSLDKAGHAAIWPRGGAETRQRPRRRHPGYTAFHQSHFGQIVTTGKYFVCFSL